MEVTLNPLSANPTKWSNTLKQFVGNLPTNCLSVFDHFVGLALKRLRLTVSLIINGIQQVFRPFILLRIYSNKLKGNWVMPGRPNHHANKVVSLSLYFL